MADATTGDWMSRGLHSLYPAFPQEGISALLQKWKVDNNKTDWDAYVIEMFAFSAFFGQPQPSFMDAQHNTWKLIDFFN